jgi:hypothetical protein
MEHGIGCVLGQARGAVGEQVLQFDGKFLFLLGLRARLPAREQGTRRQDRLRAALVRLAVEMPHAGVAEAVRVRVAGENVRRHILGEIPGVRAIRELEVHRGEVAGMIAVARADRHGDHVARLHGESFEWAELYFLRSLRRAGGEPLSRAAAVQFHRPRHPVAALGMRVLHHALDAHGRGERTAPADEHATLGRGMDRDAVGFDVARHAHMLVGGVGNDAQGIRAGPALDEVVVLRALGPAGDVIFDARLARAEAEDFKPGGQGDRFDGVLLRELRDSVLVEGSLDLGRRGEARGHAGKNLAAVGVERGDGGPQVAQGKVRTAGRDQARVFPQGKIISAVIACIGDGKIERHLPACGRRGEFQSHFARVGERCDGHLPGFGAIPFADVADLREAPECLLPLGDDPDQRVGVAGAGAAPLRAQWVEQEGDVGGVEGLP